MSGRDRLARPAAAGLCAVLLMLAAFATPAARGATVRGASPRGAVTRDDVIPRPTRFELTPGAFTLRPDTRIVAARPRALPVARDLAADLRPATGLRLPVVRGRSRAGDIVLGGFGGDSLRLVAAPGAGEPAEESYRLEVTSARVSLEAFSAHGLFDAVQTLRQLLGPAVDAPTRQAGPWSIRGVTISDQPRYPYRGFMLDVARHYRTPAEVKRLIAEVAADKIDVLHLHLSDDQGFRIAIRGFPRLTAIGGRGSVGTGGRRRDPGGFWTQAQYRSIVADAAAHFMTVVPEIDSPGHTNAIVMSEYADGANPLLHTDPMSIDCTTKRPPVWNYTGDVGYSALCPESADTWAIMRAIVGQLSALSPGPWYDLGGDEVPTTTLARRRYAAFVDRESRLVGTAGKTAMGWADFAAPGAHPPAGSIAEYWDPASGDAAGTATAHEAVAKHLKLVMAPATHAYLDQQYLARDHHTIPRDLGQNWACTTGCDVRAFYDWDPVRLVARVPASRVLGVEATIFGETTPTLADVQYLAFPRLEADAEVAWSPPARRTATSPATADFLRRLGVAGARLMFAGINFYPSPQVPWKPVLLPAGRVAARGRVVAGTLASLAAPGVDPGSVRATVAWGDGTSSAVRVSGRPATTDQINGIARLTGRHRYAAAGPYTATLTVSLPGRRRLTAAVPIAAG